jgi:hypothetical protein
MSAVMRTTDAYEMVQHVAATNPEYDQAEIKSRLFALIKDQYKINHSFWYYLYSLCGRIDSLIQNKLDQAIAAYKFDLVTSGADLSKRMHLFSDAEKWFVDQKLTGLLKNILIKKDTDTVDKKSARWISKTSKYSGHREYMLGSYVLFLLGKKCDWLKKEIDFTKYSSPKKVQKYCEKIFGGFDQDILEGITRFLASSPRPTGTYKQMLTAIGLHIAAIKSKDRDVQEAVDCFLKVNPNPTGSWQTTAKEIALLIADIKAERVVQAGYIAANKYLYAACEWVWDSRIARTFQTICGLGVLLRHDVEISIT